MRSNLFRWVLMAGLASGTLLGSVAEVSADPDVRDHRRRPKDRYDDAGPREAPPPPRAERIGRRRGFVWVSGHWDWQRGRWNWVNGHYERQRVGRKFSGIRWEKRGDVFVRVDGDWVDAGAPPPLREERFDPRPGFVFVKGRWDWDNGEWTWRPGRWERERANKRWREDRWEQRNGEWTLVGGGWEDGPPVVVAPSSQYPTSAPPTPRQERIAAKAGFVWDPGHWEWRNGQWTWLDGHWERERAGGRWKAGRWENRGGRWEWINGGWENAPIAAYPMQAPPPPPNDAIVRPGIGKVFIPGRYEFRNGRYEWKSGFIDNHRPGFRFQQGSWSQRGDRYVWTDGQWVGDYPTAAPPALRDERPSRRNGFVFIRGRWKWDGGQWQWEDGRWEKRRVGQRFNAGRWDNRGGRWEWREGSWSSAPQAPPLDEPPPALLAETAQSRPGFVWNPGHWTWIDGEYEWRAGVLVPARNGQRFVPGRWVKLDNRWRWDQADWVAEAAPPPPAPAPPSYGGRGPRQAPPAPREERFAPKQGFVWARGHYEWRNGTYEWIGGHWERERAYKKWVDAHWDLRGDVWVFTPGGWQ
jgi:hypothetical protein